MLLQKNQQFSRYDRNSHTWLYDHSLWPWTWTWRQQTNLLAWHFGPWCFITIPSLVTQDSAAERYHSDEHSLKFWTFSVTLTLTTTDQSNFFTRQFSSRLSAIKPNYCSWKRISTSDDILESHLWWHDPSLWPWPWRQQTNISGKLSGS